MITNRYRLITSADANTKVLVTATAAVLSRIVVGTTSAHALTAYDDNTTATLENKILALKASIAENSYQFDVACRNGITINVPSGYVGEALICYRAG